MLDMEERFLTPYYFENEDVAKVLLEYGASIDYYARLHGGGRGLDWLRSLKY